ncbi:hypothetical protein QSI_3863 [Clostridioides difficile P28]|nr:hypothetical protein QSI_3863 [Clostridioides difficile P28]
MLQLCYTQNGIQYRKLRIYWRVFLTLRCLQKEDFNFY